MKKTLSSMALLAVLIAQTGCKSDTKTTVETESATPVGDSTTTTTPNATANNGTFDISKLPISDTDLGVFPFFNFPEDIQPLNKPEELKFDKVFFPLNGIMTPIEGRLWKSYADHKKGATWSQAYFEKSYDEAITAVGGVKVFDGKLSKEETKKYSEQATNQGGEGSLDYYNNVVKAYVIRRASGDDVYIQLSGNSASGAIQILQKEPFKQTITLKTSSEIKKNLDEEGKAILYINFDTDKATLKPDGLKAVAEIVKVLQQDKNLKLAVNGHTDNKGSVAHNMTLSKDRADAVIKVLVNSGIEKSRLTGKGFGSTQSLTNNASESEMAQNRRVELVKQ